MFQSDTLLIRALRGNALFSGLSAGLLVLTAPWLTRQLGLPDTLSVYLVAAMLIGFALLLATMVRTRKLQSWLVAAIIAADIGWVIGTVVLATLYFESLTATGLLLIDLVAMVVLFFAIQQIRGLRALR